MKKYRARNFIQDSYNRNDQYAKDKLTQYLLKKGHEVLSDKEDYNHDLITQKGGDVFYFEFEVKRNYPFTCREDYRFKTVSFLGRKLRLHLIQPFYYVILCHETDCAVYCYSDKIYKDQHKEEINLTHYERQGIDEMYRVPVDECGFIKVI